MGCCAATDVAFANQYPGNLNGMSPSNTYDTPTPNSFSAKTRLF